MKLIALALALTAAASISALANIPRPDRTPVSKAAKGVVATMDIALDRNAKEATLIIPRSQIRQLRAELEALDGDGETAAGGWTFTSTQTIVSGVFLSLAVVFGGLLLARSGRAPRAAAAIAGIALLGSAATFLYANAGPPPEARTITGKMFSQAMHIYGFGWGQVRLQVGDEERIRLIVPNPQDPRPTE